MTVLSENKKNQYTCDGEQVVFPYTFLVLDAAHLLVVYRDAEGEETILTLNAETDGYTVDGVGEATGGNVTTTETYPALTTLTIVRDVPVTQETDYIENDIFPADSHERALDKLTMMIQELLEKVSRAILGSITDGSPDLELPNSIIRAGKLLSFDEEGDVDLTDFVPVEEHASSHEVGGEDLVDHDNLPGFVAAEHKSLPNTIAQVLSNHTKAIHDALGLSHDSLADVSTDDHHAQAHTLASHSTKAHAELTNITANQHHAESHTLASHSTKPHSALTDVTSDQHHAQSHKDRHDPNDGDDKLDTAAPQQIIGVRAAGVGVSHSFARSDHEHSIAHSLQNNHLATYGATVVNGEFALINADGVISKSKADTLTALNVEDGATADQAGAEIVALLEALIGLAKLSHTGGLSDVGANDHHNENHGLGGGTHAVTTLAGINAKITDADMDDHADARPPTAHTAASHSDITSTGAQIDDAVAKKHVEAHTLASHSTKAHTELTGVTSDLHHAKNHQATHGPAAADALKLDDLAVPDDNIDLNASVTKHGLLRKLSNLATHFLDGQGNWATPPGSSPVYQHDFPDWSQVPEVTFDSGWCTLGYAAPNYQRFVHGIGSEPDIAYLWGKVIGPRQPRIELTPIMDSHKLSAGPHIVAFDGTNIDVHQYYDQLHYTDCAGTDQTASPMVRILGISKTPDFNSGWVAFAGNPAGTQLVVAHGLGSIPDFYTLELSNNNDGSGHHVYAMSGNLNSSGNMPTTICDVDATNITFSVGTNSGVQFYDYGNNAVNVALTGWFYRIKAWTWTPDYTSGWTAVAIANPRDYILQHDLGKLPYLALLEFSKANDGSDDIVPCIGHCEYGTDPYLEGLYITSLGENTVSIHNEDGRLVFYEDSGGASQNLGTGYMRVKLWT